MARRRKRKRNKPKEEARDSRRKRKRNKPKEEARDNQGEEGGEGGGVAQHRCQNSALEKKTKTKDKAIITHHASPLLRSGSADLLCFWQHKAGVHHSPGHKTCPERCLGRLLNLSFCGSRRVRCLCLKLIAAWVVILQWSCSSLPLEVVSLQTWL